MHDNMHNMHVDCRVSQIIRFTAYFLRNISKITSRMSFSCHRYTPGRSKINPKCFLGMLLSPKNITEDSTCNKNSLKCFNDHAQPKIMIFFMSQFRVKSQIQFLAIYVKTEGFRAQRCYTGIYKHACSASFKPKTKSLRPSEAEILITRNRDHAQKRRGQF